MSVLRSIESKIEGLFEGVFGRAFRTHVQPVELARKLAKEMDEHRSVSVSRVYVPNEYSVYLSPADRQQFASYEGSLVGELQEYLAEHARREGYALLTPPRVQVLVDDDLAVGEFGIATRVAQPEDGLALAARGGAAPRSRSRRRSHPHPRPPVPSPVSVPEAAAPAITMIYPSRDWPDSTPTEAAAAEPEPEREIVTLTVAGRAHPVTSRSFVIGRSRECDLTRHRRQRVPPARRGRARGGRVLSSSISARPTARS